MVFTVMGESMAGAGALTVFVGTVAISGVLTVALMSATNFAVNSDFRWQLLVPAVIWLAGLVLHVTNHGDTSVLAGNTSAQRNL